jgi:CRP/FNR family nitrogen fixation transcriptional regulator
MIAMSNARRKPPADYSAAVITDAAPDTARDAASAPVTLTDHLQTMQAYGARQHYRANDAIFNQGDSAGQVYKILDGTVRLCRHMRDGRRHILDFLLPGDVIGFVESPDQPASAEAVTDVSLIAFPRVCFDRLARENADARKQLLCHMSQNLQSAQQHLFVVSCQKAQERVASFLLRLADRLDVMNGDRMTMAMSRQDIADHLGLTIETISRSITALRSAGLLLIPNAHQVMIRDTAALRILAAGG